MTEIKGWHVLAAFVLGFGIIIAVNLTLAFNAVRTFPGLEVKNSYVASQAFEGSRAAQEALNWDVEAWIEKGQLHLSFATDGTPVAPVIEAATLGRATHVGEDQQPVFTFDGARFTAPVDLSPGNWNLRLQARAEDGTLFRQRVIVRTTTQ